MKITDITVERFKTTGRTISDADGHGHPAPEPYETTSSIMKIHTDEGIEGITVGGNADLLNAIVRPLIIGRDPFFREEIWHLLNERQRLHKGTLSDRLICAVDLALWDLAGKATNLPVYKLLGATRSKVPAYASTMCG
ncbi:MAG: enolase, partial [Gemmatimonadetes bacterium]|nr:enolase [Gemmatimonadota bacterium]